ncbi:MAG: ABC transporter permease [Thermonemataceae bacterium]
MGTFWLVSIFAFLAVRLIPEKYEETAFYIEEATATPYDTLPLFYVSLKRSATPSFTYQSSIEKRFGNRMSWHYGNHQQLEELILTLRKLPPTKYDLFLTTASKEGHSLTNPFTLLFSDASLSIPLRKQLREAFYNLQNNPKVYQNYIPRLQWYGANNAYHVWLVSFIQGDWGTSHTNKQAVNTVVFNTLVRTVYWTGSALFLLIILSFLVAIYLHHSRFSQWRKPFFKLIYLIDTIPIFVWGTLLISILASVGWLFVSTYADRSTRLISYGVAVALLVFTNFPYAFKQLYEAISEEKKRPYVQTAYAKGLTEWQVLRKHILKNALYPSITVFSGYLPALVTGALIIEIIFSIAGIGRLLHGAVLGRDYALLLALILVIAFVRMLANLIADILYLWADPRVKV